MSGVDGQDGGVEEACAKSRDDFERDYLPERSLWTTWTHPRTQEPHEITLKTASSLLPDELDACFNLVELTSKDDYKRSKMGWKPRAKRSEMKLLDLKYLLVRHNDTIAGFTSFMPTSEDGEPVIYCYEIHLTPELQGTGLGTKLIHLLEHVASQIPDIQKVMLTCFTSNERGVAFYNKLGFEVDELSPGPKILRNGVRVECDYLIMRKVVGEGG